MAYGTGTKTAGNVPVLKVTQTLDPNHFVTTMKFAITTKLTKQHTTETDTTHSVDSLRTQYLCLPP